MTIISHGKWIAYKPDEHPFGAPLNTMFARREDGVDWYIYVNSAGSFGEDSIKLMVNDTGIVGPAVHDATMLFPAGQTVLEVTDDPVADPQATYGGMIYDAARRTLRKPDVPATPAPMPATPAPMPTVAELLARIEALEKRQ